MLSKHPITKALYKCGYNGIEDIYEFWVDNHDHVIEYYDSQYYPQDLKGDIYSFRCKIRWGGVFGLFLRLEINQYFRLNKSGSADLSTIKIRFGDKHLGIADFTKFAELEINNKDTLDLRGISILKQKIEDITLEQIDFTHASLDYTTFKNVIFKGCIFDSTSFVRTNLLDCTFDETSLFRNNDFSKAVIDSTFHCDIDNPKIRPLKSWMINSNAIRLTLKYPTFTILLNTSIVSQSNRPLLALEYDRQERFRKRAERLKQKRNKGNSKK